MAKKRLLTWHKPSRRWKKQIDGVVYYFGRGRSAADTKAYKTAEKKFLQFMEERERQQTVEIPLAEATLADVVEKYVQHQESRHRRLKHVNGNGNGNGNGRAADRTRSRPEISAAYVTRTAQILNDFVGFLDGQTPFESVRELKLEDYRNHTLTLPISAQTGRSISPRTAKDRLGEVKAFFFWAYEMGLCELPRNLRRYSRVELPDVAPNPFTLDEVRALWAAADRRTRCFMALGLNCGYGQQDISDLRAGEIDLEEGFIERGRSKTGVRTKHKLWSITFELLKAEMVEGATGDDLALRSKTGKPLVRSELRQGKLWRSDTIKCRFWRLMMKVGVEPGGRGFYSLRKTGASAIERIDPAVTEMYLGHVERGMKRHYAERDWGRLGRVLVQVGEGLALST